MRTLITIFLGLMFFGVFAAQFAMLSTTDLVRDGGTLAATLRRAQARTLALDAVQEALRRELRAAPDPAFARRLLARARTFLESAISDSWIANAIESGHQALVRYLETGEDQSLVSLGGIKGQLRKLLDDLARATLRDCRPGQPCFAPPGQGAALYDRVRGELRRVLGLIPDELTVGWLVRHTGARRELSDAEVGRAREILRYLDRFRWAPALVLALLLGLIALVNRRDLSRLLASLGLVIALSSGLYLGIQLGYGPTAREHVADALDRNLRHQTRSPVARRAARQLVLAGFDAAAQGYRGVVGGCLGLGLLLIGGAIAAEVADQRRQRRELERGGGARG